MFRGEEDNDSTSLHDQLLNIWGMAIVSGDIREGERVSLEDAGESLDINPSRTVVREVIRVLEALGLVTVKRKAGVTVNPQSQWNLCDPQVILWRLRGPQHTTVLDELIQLRAAIEPIAAKLAASHANPKQWAMLTQATIDMVANSNRADSAEFLNADLLFHCTILEASGNKMIAALGPVIKITLASKAEHHLISRVANQTALNLHMEVVSLIRKGDGEAAQKAMTQILAE